MKIKYGKTIIYFQIGFLAMGLQENLDDRSQLKKRGRPALLLNEIELKTFVKYVEDYKVDDQVTRNAVSAVKRVGFSMQQLSETESVILKQAVKPFRAYQKIEIVVQELLKCPESNRSAYQNKFVQLYQQHLSDRENDWTLNILKTMAVRYLRFQDQMESERDNQVDPLALYLSQLEKKEKKQQRNLDNHRKFELGGAVLAAFKQLNLDITEQTPEQIKNIIMNSHNLYYKVKKSQVFREITQVETNESNQIGLFFDVIDGLNTWSKNGKSLSQIEIEKHHSKYKNPHF